MRKIPKLFIWFWILFPGFIFLYRLIFNIDDLTLLSFIYAYLYNLLNSFSSILLFNLGIEKDNKTFFLLILGGMSLRLLLMLAAIIITIKFLFINREAFILVFFIFYFLLLFVEILYFHKSIKDRLNRNPD